MRAAPGTHNFYSATSGTPFHRSYGLFDCTLEKIIEQSSHHLLVMPCHHGYHRPPPKRSQLTTSWTGSMIILLPAHQTISSPSPTVVIIPNSRADSSALRDQDPDSLLAWIRFHPIETTLLPPERASNDRTLTTQVPAATETSRRRRSLKPASDLSPWQCRRTSRI
jgi:hypothetical protein